jgi:hypothetical protein
MLFNSIDFLIFLPLVYLGYWFVLKNNLRFQNLFLLFASYFFYGWWDWRFLLLLILSTLIDYSFGWWMGKYKKWQKPLLWLSVANNLGVLFIFKYYDFFAATFQQLMNSIGWQVNPVLLNIALPVGISFYTFHGMSYVFDIYRGKLQPVRAFIEYAVFVSFFPLLVAGPIERAHHLLPQIQNKRVFSRGQSVEGLRLILWGLFKKVVIADTLALTVNNAFHDPSQMNGSSLVLAVLFFSIQIYGDFSGYSDIAIGTAKLFGIELLTNFRFPYFSRDIAEFWRRWHISLTSWFRDYLYIPLGGSRQGKWMAVRNTFLIFLISGLWHGAKWTFLCWGTIHAILFLPLLLNGSNRRYVNHTVAEQNWYPSWKELFQMKATFLMVSFSWIFFRASDLTHANQFIKGMFHGLFTLPLGWEYIPYAIALMWIDWVQRRNERVVLKVRQPILQYLIYLIIAMLVLFHFPFINKSQFIYFQF